MKLYFLLTICIITAQISFSQNVKSFETKEKSKKGTFYFGFGSHRAFYSRSDIRFVNPSYPFDFTLHNVRASDDGGIRWDNKAPQYSYYVAYYFNKKNFGIRFQFDHIKYIMRTNQQVLMTGNIDGINYNKYVLTSPDFIEFEHCDGANYAMLSVFRQKKITGNHKNFLEFLYEAGAGLVIPKTESTIMGKYYHDRYAVSGYMAGASAGLRYNFLNNFFVETNVKGAYANYLHFLIADGYGKQHWLSAQVLLMAGVRLHI